MEQTLSWIATAATVIAASITASNLGSRITGYGFVVFTFGSICWFTFGLLSGQPALLWTNAVLTFLNIFGIWRWLGRQSRLEEGGMAGAKDSHDTPGEDLFALSLLTRAPLCAADGRELGHAVDAMAGCASGRIHYIVASQGGVAGVGETLRRLPWRQCCVEEERVVATLSAAGLKGLKEIEPHHWPGR